MASMNIGGQSVDQKEEEEKNFFTLSNPVFDQSKMSSKMEMVIKEVQR